MALQSVVLDWISPEVRPPLGTIEGGWEMEVLRGIIKWRTESADDNLIQRDASCELEVIK